MKALGLFVSGLVFSIGFGLALLGILDGLITMLPTFAESLINAWIAEGKIIDALFISVAVMIIGLFSFKKKEPQF